MTPDQFIQLITVGGAAGALFYVLKLLVDGKLHTNSDVDAREEAWAKERADLLKINGALTRALNSTNEHLGNVAGLLQEVLKRLGGSA